MDTGNQLIVDALAFPSALNLSEHPLLDLLRKPGGSFRVDRKGKKALRRKERL